MTRLQWDQTGQKVYETGVDRGVLFLTNNLGQYSQGFSWNGLTAVTESPSGAEANKQYADNIVYANLLSAEEFAATVEAFTYPDEFAECDGSKVYQGVSVNQQARKTFGLAYRTKIGNDIAGMDAAYKLHLIYGATAAPSERAYATVNDSPEAMTFSWELTTTPVDIGIVGGTEFKPAASLTIPSNKVSAASLLQLENLIYGTAGTDPRLPLPAEVLGLFTGTIVEVTPTVPGFNSTTKVITIPSTTGVVYSINGVDQAAGALPAITTNTVVNARAAQGYAFPAVSVDAWLYSAS